MADAVVVGGGIVGTSTAYHLTKMGAKVALLERGAIASGTSGACDGQILIADRHPGPELELGKLAAHRWKDLAQELPFDVEYEVNGSTLIAEVEEDLEVLKNLVGNLRNESVEAELVEGPAARELEPNLAEDIPGLAFFPGHGQVQPQLASWAMAEAARLGGAEVRPYTPVTGIEKDEQGRISGVVAGEERFSTQVVVCAAGVWSSAIGEMAGVDVPVIPRRGHILVSEPAPAIIKHAAMEASYTRTIDADESALAVACVIEHTKSGPMLFGSSREFIGFDGKEQMAAVTGIAARAVRFFPALASVQIIRCYTGFRPYTSDHLPILGACEAVPGFYLNTGHEGGGICMGPVSGMLVAQMVSGEETDIPMEAYNIARFGAQAAGAA